MPFFPVTNTTSPLKACLLGAAALGIAAAPGLLLACADTAAGPAVEAVFIEGAPIDRLLVTNRSGPGWQIEQITWDLTPSAGQVIFDTTGSGAGVEVFQPFRQLSARDTRNAGGRLADDGQVAVITTEPAVTDGDQSLALEFKSFAPQQVFGMSIDVDDQVANREITVENGEMQGAILQVVFVSTQQSKRTLKAVFDDRARASACAPVATLVD